MKYILIVLSIQLLFFLCVVILFALSFSIDASVFKSIPLEQLEHVTSFLKYYVTAIIAEFIAMLFFIVKFIFDKSIVELIRELFEKNG